jgi:hypothetical protein
MSDNFEAGGGTVNSTLWPYTSSTKVESGQNYFGGSNTYFHISGGGVKALSANWSGSLAGKTSTFAFDYYEAATSGDSVVVGYAAGTSDINTAGAYVRISIGAGTISFNATDGTGQTNSGTLTYPRSTRLTFSLALNDSTSQQPFIGTNLPPKRLDVWYYDWASRQKVYALAIDVAASTRSPVCVGFRTWSASTNFQAYVDNVKLLDAVAVVTPDFTPAESPPTVIVPAKPFEHPSLFNSQQELDRLKYRINHEIGTAAVAGWNQMRASSYASLNYTAVPYSNVVVMGSGTTPSESQFRQDAHAARAAALQWVITGDSRYRDKAIAIMNDWANTFVTMSPASGTSSAQIQLEAAWAAPIWLSAADIVRYYNHGAAGWNAADIAQFDSMLNYLHGQAVLSATRENNWGASAALTMIATGAYQQDRNRFDAGVQTWRDRLVGINAAVANNGYIYEVCRDTVHPQYTLQVWMQGAEAAWKQGIDLYSKALNGGGAPQFPINLENFANLFLGLSQPPCADSFLTNYNYLGEQSRAGAYDVAYNHYLIRCGMTNLPHYSDLVVNHWRPGGWDEHFCCWSSFTHGNLSAGVPAVSGLGVWDAASNAFVRTFADGDTLNLRELGAGAALAVQTTGVVSWVEYYTNGVPCGLAASDAPYAVAAPLRAGNWFLSAAPSRAMTGGSIPGDPWVRFLRVVDLPEPWQVHDLGTAAVPAWASESNGAVTLAAAGTNVAGTTDQAGLVSVGIVGDVQITSQLTSWPGAGSGSRAGLMLREGIGAEAREVFLGVAPFGTNLATVSCRAQRPGTATTTNISIPPGPVWLRLVRLGNALSAYRSADGKAWVLLSSPSLAMNSAVQAGLCVFGGAPDTLAQATFQDLAVEPLAASYTEWQNWMLAARGLTNATLLNPGTDPDGDGRSNLAEYWLGSDPLGFDAAPAIAVAGLTNGSIVRVQFRERKNAESFGRVFQTSSTLTNWSSVTPVAMTELQDFGSVVTREVFFQASATNGYFRASYGP